MCVKTLSYYNSTLKGFYAHYACEYCNYICKYVIRMHNQKLKNQKILLYNFAYISIKQNKIFESAVLCKPERLLTDDSLYAVVL